MTSPGGRAARWTSPIPMIELDEPGVRCLPLHVVLEAGVADAASCGVALRAIIILSRLSWLPDAGSHPHRER